MKDIIFSLFRQRAAGAFRRQLFRELDPLERRQVRRKHLEAHVRHHAECFPESFASRAVVMETNAKQ